MKQPDRLNSLPKKVRLYTINVKNPELLEVHTMNLENLAKLLKEHPFYIPVDVAADFLHIKPANLRASIDQGRCPFGFSWKIGERSGYKVPTVAFVSWLTKGTIPMTTM